MISEWRISRFKSIASTQRLRLRPLTILAGPNSSGKSSVIQSILLTAQSASSQVQDRHLVLNGELVRLGTFDDVHSQQATEQSFGFGFDAEIRLPTFRTPGTAAPRRWDYTWFRPNHRDGGTVRVSADVEFGPAEEKNREGSKRLQADLLSGRFTFVPRAEKGQPTLFEVPDPTPEGDSDSSDIDVRRRTDVEVEELLATVLAPQSDADAVTLRKALRYDVHLSAIAKRYLRLGRNELAPTDVTGDIVAASLEHFLPAGIIWRQHALHRSILSSLRRLSLASPAQATDLIRAWTASDDPVLQLVASSLEEFAAARQVDLRGLVRDIRRQPDHELIKELFERASKAFSAEVISARLAVPGPLSDDQELGFGVLREFFGSVRYLGPLRDDPKPVYAMTGVVDPTDVGSKGQYTAAVLDINATLDVEMIGPTGQRPIRTHLAEGVRLWLKHFGMADSVQTVDEAKLGHRLLVRPTGLRTPVDLTNVGVGVSQVLPILVMSLISSPGSVLLFEQPELHLHPAVQSLLADFFIALARSGRQCIVETHSEYLINRLRRRIAEAPSEDELQDLAVIHFVERPGAVSQFREVLVNDFGAIPEWPSGFFDQGPTESDSILAAARRKKSAKGKN